jgi:hypothetical protein
LKNSTTILVFFQTQENKQTVASMRAQAEVLEQQMANEREQIEQSNRMRKLEIVEDRQAVKVRPGYFPRSAWSFLMKVHGNQSHRSSYLTGVDDCEGSGALDPAGS